MGYNVEFKPHHECTWNLTQLAEDNCKVDSSCGGVGMPIELDYVLIKFFTYCPFCSGKINKKMVV